MKDIVRIGIDCRSLTGPGSGIPIYLYQILKNLESDPGLQIFLFSPCKFSDNFLDLQDIYTVIKPPFEINNNILKEFEGNFDIIFNGLDFSNLDRDKKFNLLLDQNLDQNLDKKEFDYIFGYKLFDTSLEGIEFKKDLIMSDVF